MCDIIKDLASFSLLAACPKHEAFMLMVDMVAPLPGIEPAFQAGRQGRIKGKRVFLCLFIWKACPPY